MFHLSTPPLSNMYLPCVYVISVRREWPLSLGITREDHPVSGLCESDFHLFTFVRLFADVLTE